MADLADLAALADFEGFDGFDDGDAFLMVWWNAVPDLGARNRTGG
jgi:hypothetical protein